MNLAYLKTRITGERFDLNIMEEENATPTYRSWLNDPIVNQYLETREATHEDLRRYIQDKRASDSCLFFGIFWKENNQHIGTVKLEPIDFEKGYAVVGILIGEKLFWGKGIATEVTNLIVDYAFNILGLDEIRLGVLEEHTAARRVYEKCGFVVDHIDEGAINHGGVLHDQVWMSKKRHL